MSVEYIAIIGMLAGAVALLLVARRENERTLARAQEDTLFWLKKYYRLSEQVFRDSKLPTEEVYSEEGDEDLEQSGERVSSPRR